MDSKYVKLDDLTEKIVAVATPRTSVDSYWKDGTIPWMASGEIHKKRVYEVEPPTNNIISTMKIKDCKRNLFKIFRKKEYNLETSFFNQGKLKIKKLLKKVNKKNNI